MARVTRFEVQILFCICVFVVSVLSCVLYFVISISKNGNLFSFNSIVKFISECKLFKIL